jgi:CBS domain containing-hemolysin-like protein
LDSPLIVDLVIAFVALAIHAIAGVAELGGGVLTHRRAHVLQEEIRSGKRTTLSLVEAARAHRASMEVVRIAAIVIGAVAIADAVDRVFDELHSTITLVVLLIVLLITGVGLPRAILSHAPESWIDRCGTIAEALARFCAPLLRIGDILVAPIRLLLPGREGGIIATEDELRSAAVSRAEDQALQKAEQQMIDGVLELEDLTASDLMVPRLDMVAVSVNTPPRQLLQMIINTGYSRIPIYENSIDEIIGVLHAKDLLPFVTGDIREVRIRRLLRPAYIVPESKRVDELLRDMRRQRLQVAIVADEYGGIAGIVSIEDIVEHIIGEIHDEYDEDEEEELVRIDDDTLEAVGGIPMAEIEDELDLDFEEIDDEDYDTIGGFVLKHLERLPKEGDVVEAGGIHVEVLKVERHRVRRVRILRLDHRPEHDQGEQTSTYPTDG